MSAEPTALHFDAGYHERLVLGDGSPVEVRLVRPEDRALFVEGFSRLSPESRYRRFMSSKRELSEAELTKLTELDGTLHFALGATQLDPVGREHGLGIARFVRSADALDTAEPAIAVVDDAQHQGLGRALLERLVAAALERGVRRFRFEVLASNGPMRSLVHELAPGAREEREDEVIVCEVELPDLPALPGSATRETALYKFLGLAARGALLVRHALGAVIASPSAERSGSSGTGSPGRTCP
jgi:GNAT superfamily N-acetyltransferase